MEKVFIYKLTNNLDWYLISVSADIHELRIMSYEHLKDIILEDLEEFPSEADFKVYSSSISAKEKFIHYIMDWCWSIFIIDQNNNVYYITKNDADANQILLSEKEADEFLNDLISTNDLEAVFNKTQAYYLENSDEIASELEKVKQYYADNNCQKFYNENIKFDKTFIESINK